MPNTNVVMIVLRDATGVPLSYGVNSVVETGFGGIGPDGNPIRSKLHKKFIKGKSAAVQPADAEVLLALRKDVALAGGGKVTIALFDRVSPEDALASASPEERREALDRADLRLRASRAGVTPDEMEAAVREELIRPPIVPAAVVPAAVEPQPSPQPSPQPVLDMTEAAETAPAPALAETTPVETAPAEPAPVEPVLAEPVPVEPVPVESAPVTDGIGEPPARPSRRNRQSTRRG